MSLIDYFKYDNPVIVYSKDNDSETKRIINLNDTILLFQLVNITTNNINNSIAYYKGYWNLFLDNGTFESTLLEIEICELGKTIDIKFSNLINDYYHFGRGIEDFYCINMKDKDLPLFYSPHYGYSYITLSTIFKNNSHYSPEDIRNLIVSESDLIIHKNKQNPIEKNFDYHITTSYNSFEYTQIHYNLQFIKYESDNGLIYKNSNIFRGISFSDTTNFRITQEDYDFNDSNEKEIGKITIGINKSNFDNYKRTYPRIQSLLADVMSVVNLLFDVGRIVILFLSEKNMSKDIIKYILYGESENNEKKNICNKVFKNQIAITESGLNIRNEKEEKENTSYNSNEKNNTKCTNIFTDNKDFEFDKKNKTKSMIYLKQIIFII